MRVCRSCRERILKDLGERDVEIVWCESSDSEGDSEKRFVSILEREKAIIFYKEDIKRLLDSIPERKSLENEEIGNFLNQFINGEKEIVLIRKRR